MFGEVDVMPIRDAGFGVGKVKTWQGMEGEGFQFDLVYEGESVSLVSDDAHGGEVRVEWVGISYNGTPIARDDLSGAKLAKYQRQQKAAQKAKAKLDALVKAIPPVPSEYDEDRPLTVSLGWALSEFLELKEMERKLLTKTGFHKPGDDPQNGYRVINEPYNTDVRNYVLKKWPGSVILNEKFGMPCPEKVPTKPPTALSGGVRMGDRVIFTDRDGKTIIGVVARVNRKTVTVMPDQPTRPGQYWRVSPAGCRPAPRA